MEKFLKSCSEEEKYDVRNARKKSAANLISALFALIPSKT
jgi:hypothetical protein